MAFHTTRISHPVVSAPRGGTSIAGAQWTPLGGRHYLAGGVKIGNGDASENILVRVRGSSDGMVLTPGEARYFPSYLLANIEVKSQSGADAVIEFIPSTSTGPVSEVAGPPPFIPSSGEGIHFVGGGQIEFVGGGGIEFVNP